MAAITNHHTGNQTDPCRPLIEHTITPARPMNDDMSSMLHVATEGVIQEL